MYCLLLAEIFSSNFQLKNKTFSKMQKKWGKYWISRNFVSPEKWEPCSNFFNLLFFFLMFIQLLWLPSYVYPVLNSVCIPVQIKLTFISMHKFESSGCVHSFLSSSYHVFIPLFSLSLGVPDSVPIRQRARV